MPRVLALAALLLVLVAGVAGGAPWLQDDCCASSQAGDECEQGCMACLHCTAVPAGLPEQAAVCQSLHVTHGTLVLQAAAPERLAAAAIFHPPRTAAI